VLPKASVFIATSLDGFIARPNGEIDWLDKQNAALPPGEDCGYNAFMESVDALVMGRHTYEKVLGFDRWPYPAKRVIVLSSNEITIPDHLREAVEHSSEEPRHLFERIASEGIEHVYLDGGVTVQSFLSAGLVDEITITTIPVLLGTGRRLFSDLPHDVSLRHQITRTFDFGFVQTRYLVESAF